MIKKFKKGFTLIELVVVIAVIAILSAISVISYVSITNRAKESNDHMVIDQINTSFLSSQILEKKATVHEIVERFVEEEGYDVRTIKPELKNAKFVYSYEKGKFGYWKDSKVVYPADLAKIDFTGSNDLWFFEDEAKATYDDSYSHYLKAAGSVTEITTNGGLDVGGCTTISSINLIRPTKAAKDVVVRTNGGTLSVNAPADTVRHYGEGQIITLKAVADHSYYENGKIDQVNIKNGRLVLTNTEGSSVGTIYLQATGETYDNIIIATQTGAELPDLIARDNVPLPTGNDAITVVTIQSNVNQAGENPEKVETINLYAEKDVKEKDNGYNVSDLGLLVVEAISSEAQTQAAEQITNPEVVAKVCETKAAIEVKTENELTDALNAKAKYIIVTDSFDTTKAFLIKGSTVIEGAKLLDGTYPTITSKATTQSEKRGFRISTSNIDVNLRNLTVDVRTNVTSDGGYPRGLQIDSNKTGIKLSVDNCNISATHYAFNVCNGADVEAVFTNSHLLGYGALNLWNASYAVVVKNSTLEGIQNGSERFAVIVLEGDTTYQTTMHSTAIAVKLSQTEIIATSNKADGTEAFIGFNSNATSNVVEIDNCTMVKKGIGQTPSFYDSGKSNKIIANCGTYDYEEWEEVSGEYSFNPSTIGWTVDQVISWAESNGFTNIYENDGIVYYTVYIPAGNVIDESYEIPAGYKAVVSNDKSTFTVVKNN